MDVTIQCEACKHSYAVDQSVLGSRAKCSKCGHVFIVPWLPPPDDDPFKYASAEPTIKLPPPPEPKWKVAPVPIFEPAAALAVEDVKAGTGRSGKGRGASAINTATSYVLFLFIAASITFGVFATAQVLLNMNATSPVWRLIGNIWAWVACVDVLLFAVHGPMLWFGMWIASKILRFPLVDGAYRRSCAVAAPATALFVLATMTEGPARTLCFLSIIPAMFLMLKIFFELDWAEGGVGFATGGIAWVVAVLLGNAIVGQVISESALTQVRASLVSVDHGQQADAPSNNGRNVFTSSSPASDDQTLAQLRDMVNQKTSLANASATREQLAPDVDNLRRRRDLLRPKYHANPQFDELSRQIDSFEKTVLALPSGKVDSSVFQDVPDAEDWTTGNLSRGKLAAEVSIGQFKFQPPREMKIDLRSSEETDDGLAWIAASGPAARLSISTRPRQDPRQRRPIVSDQPPILHSAESSGLLAIDTAHVTASSGQINGIPVTRIASNDDAPLPRSIQYIAATDNDKWLILRLMLPPGSGALPKIMEASARTIRKTEQGDAPSDPFAASLIAPRISEDPDRIATLLRKQGPAAEGPVLELLRSNNASIRERALQILHDVATEQSLPALRQAALDRDQKLAALALQDIEAIESHAGAHPGEPRPHGPVDVAAFATLSADLENEDPARRKSAVKKLPFVDGDPQQRAAVSHRLASMLKTRDPGVPLADIVKALLTWTDPGGAKDFIPLLDDKADPEARHLAMKILGQMKAQDAAIPLAKWLALDPQPASDALIAIGSPAEAAVIVYLRNKSPQIRGDAAKILARIGTRQSLLELAHAAHDPRDANAQKAAAAALDAVRARTGAE